MCRYNDCDKCPHYSCFTPYWSDDGCPVESCGAGLNPEDGCKYPRLVRWILYKIKQRKLKKEDEYYMKLLKQEEEEEVVGKTYNDCITTPAGKIKGCAYCSDKYICSEAFTGIADKCGAFDKSLMNNCKEE